jgi:ubiquinone/menaquinone biosynthesis C-methylase UbiE
MATQPIAAHYNSRATAYDNHTPFHTNLAKLFVEYAKPKRGDHVLDLACGTGLVTFALLPHVFNEKGMLNGGQKVIGIDISPGMLDIARSKVMGLGGVSFVDSGVEDLRPIREMEAMEKKFDIITICSALVLLPAEKLGDMMKHWSGYLAPGGRLVVDIPTTSSMLRLRALSEIFPELGLAIMGDRRWIVGPESLRKLMEDAGLETKIETVEASEDREWLRTVPARTKVLGKRGVVGQWDVGEAGLVLNGAESAPTWFEELDEEQQNRAREMFEKVWRGYADQKGVIREVGGLWVGIGVQK